MALPKGPLLKAIHGGDEKRARELLPEFDEQELNKIHGAYTVSAAAHTRYGCLPNLSSNTPSNLAADSFDYSFLTMACYLGNPDIVRALLESGASLELKVNGMPVLHHAYGGAPNFGVIIVLAQYAQPEHFDRLAAGAYLCNNGNNSILGFKSIGPVRPAYLLERNCELRSVLNLSHRDDIKQCEIVTGRVTLKLLNRLASGDFLLKYRRERQLRSVIYNTDAEELFNCVYEIGRVRHLKEKKISKEIKNGSPYYLDLIRTEICLVAAFKLVADKFDSNDAWRFAANVFKAMLSELDNYAKSGKECTASELITQAFTGACHRVIKGAPFSLSLEFKLTHFYKFLSSMSDQRSYLVGERTSQHFLNYRHKSFTGWLRNQSSLENPASNERSLARFLYGSVVELGESEQVEVLASVSHTDSAEVTEAQAAPGGGASVNNEVESDHVTANKESPWGSIKDDYTAEFQAESQETFRFFCSPTNIDPLKRLAGAASTNLIRTAVALKTPDKFRLFCENIPAIKIFESSFEFNGRHERRPRFEASTKYFSIIEEEGVFANMHAALMIKQEGLHAVHDKPLGEFIQVLAVLNNNKVIARDTTNDCSADVVTISEHQSVGVGRNHPLYHYMDVFFRCEQSLLTRRFIEYKEFLLQKASLLAKDNKKESTLLKKLFLALHIPYSCTARINFVTKSQVLELMLKDDYCELDACLDKAISEGSTYTVVDAFKEEEAENTPDPFLTRMLKADTYILKVLTTSIAKKLGECGCCVQGWHAEFLDEYNLHNNAWGDYYSARLLLAHFDCKNDDGTFKYSFIEYRYQSNPIMAYINLYPPILELFEKFCLQNSAADLQVWEKKKVKREDNRGFFTLPRTPKEHFDEVHKNKDFDSFQHITQPLNANLFFIRAFDFFANNMSTRSSKFILCLKQFIKIMELLSSDEADNVAEVLGELEFAKLLTDNKQYINYCEDVANGFNPKKYKVLQRRVVEFTEILLDDSRQLTPGERRVRDEICHSLSLGVSDDSDCTEGSMTEERGRSVVSRVRPAPPGRRVSDMIDNDAL